MSRSQESASSAIPTEAVATDTPAPAGSGPTEAPGAGEDPGATPDPGGGDAVTVEPPTGDAAAGPDAGAEVLPPVESDPGVPALPPSDPIPPLLHAPAPDTATAEGALVDGFPSFLTPAPSSTVAASMVASEGANVQAAFSATSTNTVEAVQDYFDGIFAALALHPTQAPAVGGSTAWAYSRGAESVTVTLTPTARGCDYSILATLVAV